MALNPVTELEAIVDVLNAEGIPYALCGGLALGLHGYPRATKDIDLLVEAAEIDRALAAVKQIGFDIPARKIVFGLRSGKQREVRRVSKLDSSGDLMPLDFLIVSEELAEVWATRITIDTGVRKLTIVSRDGLATMKRLAGRPQDLVDIAKLEGTDDEES
jgi:hypothetical protein